MRYSILLLAIVAGIAATPIHVKAQERVNVTLPNVPTATIYKDTLGSLAFSRTTIRVTDNLRSDQDRDFVFQIRNVGRKAVVLQPAVQCPEYFTATLTKTKLNPGEETTVTAKWLGAKAAKAGLVNHNMVRAELALQTDDAKLPRKSLFIEGGYERIYSAAEMVAAPRIKFERTEFDGGNVIMGEKLVVKYVFKNEGQSPLRVSDVRASCGCTATAPADSVVMPGASSYITATFDSRNRQGAQHKSITLQTNDPLNPSTTLQLRCNVVNDPFSGGGGAPTAPGAMGSNPF